MKEAPEDEVPIQPYEVIVKVKVGWQRLPAWASKSIGEAGGWTVAQIEQFFEGPTCTEASRPNAIQVKVEKLTAPATVDPKEEA